jgi:hypothetical protein
VRQEFDRFGIQNVFARDKIKDDALLLSRAARWYIRKPKLSYWVDFGGPYVK